MQVPLAVAFAQEPGDKCVKEPDKRCGKKPFKMPVTFDNTCPQSQNRKQETEVKMCCGKFIKKTQEPLQKLFTELLQSGGPFANRTY